VFRTIRISVRTIRRIRIGAIRMIRTFRISVRNDPDPQIGGGDPDLPPPAPLPGTDLPQRDPLPERIGANPLGRRGLGEGQPAARPW
jgi:hypothetical protein